MKATDNRGTDLQAVAAGHCAPAYSSVQCWQSPQGSYHAKQMVTFLNPISMNLLKPSGHYMYRKLVTVCTAQWSLYVHYMYRKLVAICTAQWSLYVSHSGHYMYRTVVTTCTALWSLHVQHSGHYMYRTVVTVCTAQWSLYVQPSGHCMYSPVVTVCTAQWSLYVQPSDHCLYRTVVIICTAQWSLYVPHSGHYMYNQVWHYKILRSAHTVYLCILCGSENKHRLFPYTPLTGLYNRDGVCLLRGTDWVFIYVKVKVTPWQAYAVQFQKNLNPATERCEWSARRSGRERPGIHCTGG